ncbi:hypothetical protein SMACR_01535 [Sordaria macrospora]|uniref:WGS project CABT00000000 data, contig 2.4 n=2 Tax=Sordaria macrospora TaxID=5147 RepID=F7VR38_SORMK|nr:uncharacterized protein SMAC_01535 [Sordaria macrospora k-hell]KAA8635358.1 hypothetical protein SMACR_01535 [Sordaria macrospora]KAH7634644.1 hypothetical protein B0T09DRAFT_316533 [Sordaria sp. MPI-SDFR-AT-0083]WPJ58576.1 hypothetical protein SMAC4_01535 [Sordaria macrospora]CCC07971.1 unnamed protein product [Sordaria macrospora k-hell]
MPNNTCTHFNSKGVNASELVGPAGFRCGTHRGFPRPVKDERQGIIDVSIKMVEGTGNCRAHEVLRPYSPLQHLLEAMKALVTTANGANYVSRSSLVPVFGSII